MNPVTYNNASRLENITRPNNATAYAASGTAINDGTARNLVFPVTSNRRGGYITRAQLVTNSNAHTAAIRLHLFSAAPAVVADQASLAGLTYANGQAYEGYIDFSTFVPLGNFSVSEGILISRPMQFLANRVDSNIYGILEARAAFTPVALQQFATVLFTEFSA